MSPQEHPERTSDQKVSFWRSPTGITLAVFLAAVGFLFIFEHRAHLAGIPPLVLLLLLCGGMHFFMHRGHGGHGGGRSEGRDNDAR